MQFPVYVLGFQMVSLLDSGQHSPNSSKTKALAQSLRDNDIGILLCQVDRTDGSITIPQTYPCLFLGKVDVCFVHHYYPSVLGTIQDFLDRRK